ncbi:MAG: hypothetical protein A2Y25_00320 [Candidatus Melainabacteria bacterium GWF2_37_15]|nr:MAG: hypothetical protein A2Y25_00320 [Candidatus Melainabacteria bacterium GWF2_37_15]
MKKFKLIALTLISLFVFTTFSTAAPSKDFGVVDLNKVIDNYTEAQKVAADLKVKENELQGFVEDAQKKVKEAKSPVEKKNLEEKFSEEFNIKRNAYVKSQSEKWDTIESNILKGIQEIYTRKKLEMVFNKQSVIVGGTDITDELIKNLNETVKK